VMTAAYGYGLVNDSVEVAVLGLFAVILFMLLDARYLREERAFRALFTRASQGNVRLYDMNTKPYYGKANGDAEDLRQINCRWRSVLKSWTIAGFYIPAAVVGIVVVSLVISPISSHFGEHPVPLPTHHPSVSPSN